MKLLPVFLCGPHCSGKTSILKELQREGVFSERGSEIGKDLFYQRRIDTASQGEAFEKEITAMELARDRAYAEKRGTAGIESWHPGNLAYAAVRNPSVVPCLLDEMRKSPLLPFAYGICFSVSWENIYSRTRTFQDDPKWAADFYTRIASHLKECVQWLGLAERCVWIDANRPYDDVCNETRAVVRKIRASRSDGVAEVRNEVYPHFGRQ